MIGQLLAAWRSFPWTYARKGVPGPGSQNIAYETLALNPYTPIGAGIANQKQFMFQGPQLIIPHLVGISGIGGNDTGQFVGTPLIVLQTGNASQIVAIASPS